MQLNFAAEQTREFAADGKSEARAAVFAARAGVGLLERFENDALLFGKNADARVGDFERDHRAGAAEDRVLVAPTVVGDADRKAHAALLGEFEGVREQILEHLLETLRVGDDTAHQVGIGVGSRT